MMLKKVVAACTLLQGNLFKHCNRWCIVFCNVLGTHTLVNFVDEDLSATMPMKRLIEIDAEGDTRKFLHVLLTDKKKYKVILIMSG